LLFCCCFSLSFKATPAVHHADQSPFRASSAAAHVRPPHSAVNADTKKTHHEHRTESHAIVVSYPKSSEPKSVDSTEDIVVEIRLPTPPPPSISSSAPVVASAIGHPHSEASVAPKRNSNRAQIVVPAVLACLVFLIAVVLIARCYVRRMRLQRAGYNLTVVEVDEVANTEASTGHGLGRGRLTVGGGAGIVGTGTGGGGPVSGGVTNLGENHDSVDPLTRWQLNGYENPAYKFTEGGYIFSPAD
uniref:APP_amyloid domain-containing protein n=1 Tax=Echinostoma caproni TaxID=27848 RepID=A0A183B4S3_9TREM